MKKKKLVKMARGLHLPNPRVNRIRRRAILEKRIRALEKRSAKMLRDFPEKLFAKLRGYRIELNYLRESGQ
jgi:hypothetical protein